MNARKIILGLVLLIVAANLALMVVVLAGALVTPSGAPPVPKPNGHDDFVRAEKMLPTKAEDYTKNLNLGQLRAIVATNSPALAVVRTGLGRESVVPIEDLKWTHEEHVAQLRDFKRVDLAFSAEATLAEVERRTNDAMEICLELIRFSHASSHGGSYSDAFTGDQSENFGLAHLNRLVNSLDAVGCAHVAKTLEEIDGRTDTLAQIVSQNRIYTGKLTFSQSFFRVVHFRRFRNADRIYAARFNEEAKQRRTTMVAFAARAYELAKGKRPAGIAELVPAYLQTVPQDPSTQLSLDYKP